MILSMLIMAGLLYLSDAKVLALIVAAKVKEVALVACTHNVAASVCGCQTRRCRARTHYGLLANQRNLHPRQRL